MLNIYPMSSHMSINYHNSHVTSHSSSYWFRSGPLLLFFDFLFDTKIYAIKFPQFGAFLGSVRTVKMSVGVLSMRKESSIISGDILIVISVRIFYATKNSLLTWFSSMRWWFYYSKEDDAGRYRRDKQSQSMRKIWVIYLFTICGGDVGEEKIQVFVSLPKVPCLFFSFFPFRTFPIPSSFTSIIFCWCWHKNWMKLSRLFLVSTTAASFVLQQYV